jgi:rapamycin-insensitive companion of mTOR
LSILFDGKTENEPNYTPKLKAAIWIVAHIGSTDTGFEYLAKIYPGHKIIDILLNILKTSDTLSVRGTCLFAISLIAKSKLAAEQLEILQWSIKDGICVPNEISSLFDVSESDFKKLTGIKMTPWEFEGSWPSKRTLTFKSIDYKMNEVEKEILKCIGNLSNHIVASANSKRLVA